MSEQERPDPFPLNPVFNVVNWLQPPNLAGTIDVAYLDSHYLRFPLAQGLQTLLDVNVNGTANFYKSINVWGTSSVDRQVRTGFFVMNDTNNNTATVSSRFYHAGTTCFISNLINGGSLYFANYAGGSPVNCATFTSTLNNFYLPVIINNIGNYLQFPDGTQQTTAYTGGSSGTYSIRYTTNQTITIPNNCRSIDVYVCGAGGLAGAPNGLVYGGMGSAGNSIWCSGIPMNSGEQLQLVFATGSGNSTRINYLTFPFAVAYNGLNGQDASAGGAGGQPNFAQASSGDTTFGSWTSAQGSAGSNGGTTTLPVLNQKTACPKGISTWVATNNGCGQRETTTALATGVIIITYNIYT
jgi:hypothetical protein